MAPTPTTGPNRRVPEIVTNPTSTVPLHPFCEFVPPPPPSSGGIVPHAYSVKGTRRASSTLTWRLAPGIVISGVATPATQIATACSRWTAAAPQLSLTQTTGASADITITTGTFTNPNTIASTTPDGLTITVNSAYTFVPTSASGAGTDFLNIITHELGHALGLLHATTNTSIMWAFASTLETLQADDTAAIRALYSWSPQRALQGGTDTLPAVCNSGGVLVMVWKGIGNDHNIWCSTSADGQNWTPQRTIPGCATTTSPGLAWDGIKTWMVWTGTVGDDSLYYATSGDYFQHLQTGVQHLGDRGSSHGPRIAIVGGVPTMVWKGVRNDNGIYYATFNGAWSRQVNLPGIGTSSAPAICQDILSGARLVWRGSGNDQTLWTTNVPANLRPIQTPVTWQIPGNGGTPATFGSPASTEGPNLTYEKGHVYMTWRGVANDQSLYYTQFANDGTLAAPLLQWSVQSPIPNTGSSIGVSVARIRSVLHAVWKGINNDHGIYTATL